MAFVLITFLVSQWVVDAENGDAFGYISKIETQCEHHAISVGSNMVDIMNVIDEEEPLENRYFDQRLAVRVGFADSLYRDLSSANVTSSTEDLISTRKVKKILRP